MTTKQASVIRPGDLIFFGDREERMQYVRITDWSLSHPEAPLLSDTERRRILLEAVVRYVAGKLGVEVLVGPEECNPTGVFVKYNDEPPVTLDVERAAQDVIAMARWTQSEGEA